MTDTAPPVYTDRFFVSDRPHCEAVAVVFVPPDDDVFDSAMFSVSDGRNRIALDVDFESDHLDCDLAAVARVHAALGEFHAQCLAALERRRVAGISLEAYRTGRNAVRAVPVADDTEFVATAAGIRAAHELLGTPE